MCFRRKPLKTVTKNEIVDAICMLEREETSIENKIMQLSTTIKALIEEGQSFSDKLEKIFIVKKITNLSEQRSRQIKQGLYVLYNIKMANRLKDVLEDKQLVKNISSLKFSLCLEDQKELALFLNDALDTKTKHEDVLTNADDTYVTVKSMFDENMKIYGITDVDEDELMALFELKNMPDNADSEDSREIR